VRQRGEVVAPVIIEARYEDGSSERLDWDGRGGFARFRRTGESRLASVTVDPDRLYAIDLDTNNNGWRLEPAPRTVAVLQAFALHWCQNALDGWSLLF
jgi:hypothetical protein